MGRLPYELRWRAESARTERKSKIGMEMQALSWSGRWGTAVRMGGRADGGQGTGDGGAASPHESAGENSAREVGIIATGSAGDWFLSRPSSPVSRPPSMPPTRTRLPTPEERAAELAATERAVRREIRWVYARAAVLCLVWMVIGLALVGWAVNTTDEQSGLIAFWGGLLIGNVGILATLFVTFNQAVAEGWV